MKKVFLSLICAASFSIAPFVAQAKEYPEKSVVMSVAYSPGGGNDTVSRLMARHIEPYLGARMVVENNPGAGGQVGFTRLAKSKPDGYTIGLLSSPSIFMIELLRDRVEYSLSDFQPIANIQTDPIMLLVNNKSDIQSFEDFLAYVKNNPGKLNIGGDGPQSNVHLQAAAIEEALKIDLNFISYAGSGPAATGLLGNEVQAALLTASSAAQFIESGRMRALAVFNKERHPSFPAISTAEEVAGVTVPSIGAALRGVAAPKGVSPEIVTTLENAFKSLLNDQEFQNAAEKMGVLLDYKGSEEFEKELIEAREQAKQYLHLMK